ncbi:hypothetical protein ACKWTF_004809 [Chironomus riparius]
MTANIISEKLTLFKNINIRSSLNESFKDQEADKLAGFLQSGKFSWIAFDAILRIVSTDTGVEIAYCNFAKHHGIEGCIINYVEEINYLPGICILAVSIEFINNAARAGMVCLFCVQGCKLLGSMDMCERITCCKYIERDACRRSVLRQFHGTLAIGTDQGKLFLVDLMIPKDIKEIILSPSYDCEIFPMTNVSAELDQMQINHHHNKIVSNRETGERCFFSIQLKQVLEETGAIITMLCMPNLNMLAVGLDDGRMILYDLIDLQAFHLAHPPANRSPLTHMSYIEPADDPRSAVYVWTFHSSKDGGIAVMHSIMFENRVNGFYENFRSCSVRLTMPVFYKDTFPICCRSISKTLSQDEEDVLTISLLAWTSPTKNLTHIMVFDLNQWYKEEMPNVGDWRNPLKYAVVFELPNMSLDVILNEKSLLPFNSIMRPEEHFYPNSLNFDIIVLETNKFAHYRWNGIQNLVLQQFNNIGPQIILEPSYYFNELIQVAITPQFYDVNFGIATPLDLKREFLLSVALEYNFTGFLKKCAWAWADGSYLGKDENVGIGLSTLTEWIWNRVRAIKEVCNQLCQPLFDFSEQRIDCGTQKQLSLCCKQLKILSELLQMIAKDYQKYIPADILIQINTQANTVKMASDYQEVLQWLLNVGLLPEGHHNKKKEIDDENDFVIVPYPYRSINSHYANQRSKLNDAENQEDKPAKYLFIDAFIENECSGYDLLDWSSFYPPKSIQSLLRSLLVPDIPIENKYVIFIYLFMDITNVLNETSYSNIVRNLIKFPAVFKMNPSVIKRTQAFWNLDNGQLETAVEELISPLSHDRYLPKWQRELLIGALLKQNANSLALRALRCPGNPISSELEVSTLLSNNLISEALKIQRASGDRSLLEKLFHKILHSSNYEQLLDLALTEDEGKVLRDYLQNTDLSNCVNLHFVYLLQRSKFIDAATLMDSFDISTTINLEPPKQVLNAYYSTMEPTTRKLTSMVYSDNQVQVKDIPSPLSVNLIKSRCNATNDIYKKCVQSITEATYDTIQELKEMPFIGSPKLGIFEYKQPIVEMQEASYPMEFNDNGKRLKDNTSGIFILEDFEGPRKKRRRLEDVIDAKKPKSFVDKRISLLPHFRNRRPKLNFTSRTPSTSSRVTPDRVALFGDLLKTPIIEKRTPQKSFPERAATPASILKTRSCRSSPSRFSEFDDNKSVKSITFAENLQDSSYLDESFGEQQLESSAEFFSPEKSPKINPIFSTSNISPTKSSDVIAISSTSTISSGPKARPPIKSRSTTPSDQPSQENNFEITIQPIYEEKMEMDNIPESDEDDMIKDAGITAQSTTFEQQLDESTEIDPFQRDSVLKSSYDIDSSESEEDKTQEDSIYKFVRKSVLPDNPSYSDSSADSSILEPPRKSILKSSDDDEDIAEDEHFEEVELPEHSDYDDDSEQDSDDYGNIDLDDSDESDESSIMPNANEIIEIPDSDDDDVQIESNSPKIPSFNARNPQNVENIIESSNEERREILELATADNNEQSQPMENQEQMIDILYDDIEQQNAVNEIKSPSFEQISPQKSSENIESGSYEIEVTADVQEKAINPQNEENEPFEDIQLIEIAPNAVIQSESDELLVQEVQFTQPENVLIPKIEQKVSKESIADKNEKPEQQQVMTEEKPLERIIPIELETNNQEKIEIMLSTESKQDVSEMSEDYSFASAQNELNDAAIITTVDDTLVDDEEHQLIIVEEQEMEIVDETMEIMDEGQSNIEENNHNLAIVEQQDMETIENPQKFEEQTLEVSNKDLEGTNDNLEVTESSNVLDKAIVMENDPEMTQDETLQITEHEVTNPLEVALFESDISEKMVTAEENLEQTENNVTENILDVAKINETQNDDNKVKEAQVEKQASDNKSQQDDNDREIEEIMTANKSPEQSQSVPVDLSTPKRRSTRLKSTETTEENTRIKRAVSVPSSGTSSPISRSSRASSENRHNPKVLLKEKMLERIEESPSSGMLTRTKSRLLNEQNSRETTPQSRAPSEEVESGKKTPRRRSTATPTTPRRIFTRGASRDSFGGDNVVSSSQVEEKTPEEVPKKGRGRKKASGASDDEHDDNKSTKSEAMSTRSTSSKKKETPISSSKISPIPSASPIDELNTSNRRLTRSQLGVLEKSRLLAEKMSNEPIQSPARLRPTKSDLNSTREDDSDNDSVKSDSTTSRTSRKRKLPKRATNQDSETSSIASKQSRKSKSPLKKHLLSVIHEEGGKTQYFLALN